MYSHIMIGTDDIDRAKAFYERVLGVLDGDLQVFENENKTGHRRVFFIQDGGILALTQPIDGQPVSTANGSTIGFACNSGEQVKEFHDVAVEAGATPVEDPPGLREGGAMGPLHLCYFRDLDGHKICGIHRSAA